MEVQDKPCFPALCPAPLEVHDAVDEPSDEKLFTHKPQKLTHIIFQTIFRKIFRKFQTNLVKVSFSDSCLSFSTGCCSVGSLFRTILVEESSTWTAGGNIGFLVFTICDKLVLKVEFPKKNKLIAPFCRQVFPPSPPFWPQHFCFLFRLPLRSRRFLPPGVRRDIHEMKAQFSLANVLFWSLFNDGSKKAQFTAPLCFSTSTSSRCVHTNCSLPHF